MIYFQLILTILLIFFPDYYLFFATVLISSFLLQIVQKRSLKKEIHEAVQQLDEFQRGQFGKRLFSKVSDFKELISSINLVLEQYQAEEQATRVKRQQMIDRLSHISHDLRTPLTSLLGYIDALKDDIYSTDEARRDAILTLYEKASRIKSYTENFFHLSQLENPEKEFELSEDNIAETLRESIIELIPVIEQHKIKTEIDIPDESVIVPMHRHSIKRVFINLIDNAIKYAGPEHYLLIRLKQDEKNICITIADKGAGIPDEQWLSIKNNPKLFSKSGGFGLVIIQRIIDYHHGQFEREFETGLHQVIITLPKQI